MLPNKTLTYISLFSSAGVGCYGFKEAGFECISTNEIIERRLRIQMINNKCKFQSGYVLGDVREKDIKKQIKEQIEVYKKLGNDKVDVLIATPPCQGMSVANHKKQPNEIDRNSLVVESVNMIVDINPRFFIIENVSSFYKTGCIAQNGKVIQIGDMIEANLAENYCIYHEIINFKNYGSNSSRTRTLVIGVCKELANFISPLELFPDFTKQKSLKQVIGHLRNLQWGEFDKNDFFHSFRTYPAHMREWIKDIAQGQSAFENKDEKKRPHQTINGKIVLNKAKNGDKYTRQKWESVAPCVHTRNDQLASQNTIHPVDDRVFSIRELMLMMSIPNNFKWIDASLEQLNSLSDEEKIKTSKKYEINIRQSIGEAVPTVIFRQIAQKISNFMRKQKLKQNEITNIITKHSLINSNKLKEYIISNKDNIDTASLSTIAEMSNAKRESHSAYFTNRFIVNEIAKTLPTFNKNSITIIEPSAGCGNFLPIIFKKYENVDHVNLKLIDIDGGSLEILKILYCDVVPTNFNLEFINTDFMKYETKADLIIGNPPFSKLSKNSEYSVQLSDGISNLAGAFLEKSLKISDYVSMIMPKNLLNTKDYRGTRELLAKIGVSHILDFGELGFSGVLIETINITTGKQNDISVKSLPLGISLKQKKNYIFDKDLPYWVIYRNFFFDTILSKMDFGIFDVFRDRQLTNSNTSIKKTKQAIRVLKSRNITDNGEIIQINGYDSYIEKSELDKLTVSKFINRDDVYLTPNMTYNPRLVRKESGYVVNGSVAILIPKTSQKLSDKQLKYISSSDFREFYKIARNYQTRTLNVDSVSCFWFGALKEEYYDKRGSS